MPSVQSNGSNGSKPIPFDTKHLDRLMDDAGLDLLVVTSKHNVQYLLGGYRFIFFDYMDAIGTNRYLPVFVYPKGRPEKAAYIGHRLEGFEKEIGRFWPAHVETKSNSGPTAIQLAVDHIKTL